MRASQILEDQIIHVKRGRLNGLGFEPAFNSYFDFYLDCKFFGEPLLELQDVTFHLYLRKNLNDTNPRWRMPTLRQMKKKFGVSYDKIYAMFERLNRAHLLSKQSGVRVGTVNVRNAYLLSDPIATLNEFLEVANQNLFKLTLLSDYSLCSDFRNIDAPETGTSHATEIGADQQTAIKEQTADTLETRLWDNVLKQLQLPEDTFNTFMVDTMFHGIEDGIAVITTSRSYTKDWLENRMSNQIKKVLAVELKMNGGQQIESVRFEIG